MSGISAKDEKSEWVRTEGTEIYKRTSNGTYYERPAINGIRTFRSLKTKNQRDALAEWSKREAKREQGEDPQPKQKQGVTVGDVLKKYKEDHYPDRNRKVRPETMMKSEAANCINLYQFWKIIRVDDITLAECDRYHDWRVKTVTKGSGDRTVDLELNTLRNALVWSARCELIKHIPPPHVWKRYRESGEVQHCREFMVHDANELHKITLMMFKSEGHNGGRSQVLGWQILIEGYTGLRTIEALGLRFDAKPYEPGWISEDGNSLCVRRAKDPKNKSLNPFVEINEGLKQTFEAFSKWHKFKHPESPWYFPSPRVPDQAVDESCLSHAMAKRISKALGRKITSHGLRAFYVTVRRSHGIPDAQIGWEIGHEPGQTLAEVYGGVPPHWMAGGGPKMSWLPAGEPAWTTLNLSAQKVSAAPAAPSKPE